MRGTHVFLLTILLVVAGCRHKASQPKDASLVTSYPSPQRIETRHLPNTCRIHDRVISGGEPDGEVGFQELRELGVKTVISVDGARPQVELARKYGIRYVHLPHGYDGVPLERAHELAKAVRDLPGPVYIHCHHGKHRSPAAAAVACVGAGLLSPKDAVSVLHIAGTSKDYQGLYESVKNARRFDGAMLDTLTVEFSERAELPPIAEAMVAIEHTYDNLKVIQQAGWKSPTDHPDLDPPHEALLLREHFAEVVRTEAARQQPSQFQDMLQASLTAAADLEDGLRDWIDPRQPPPEVIANSFVRITNNCKACHGHFRDIPLSEKLKQNP